MAFFDDLGRKTQALSEISRLNALISEEEKKANTLYCQIGKLYASLHGSACEEEFFGMMVSVLESEQNIKNYRTQIQSIKGIGRCEKCGAEVSNDAAFCSICGAPVPRTELVTDEDWVRCGHCGVLLERCARFCTSCGKPIIAREEIKKVNPERSCPSCGTRLTVNTVFCTECGTKL